jgi:hypothetical protein
MVRHNMAVTILQKLVKHVGSVPVMEVVENSS